MFPGTHAATNPEKPALIMAGSGRVVTYGQLEERSARLARALHDLGLRKGDVFAMLSDNTAEALELYWAALRSGLYITAVNHNLAADEAAYIVRNRFKRFQRGSRVGMTAQLIDDAHHEQGITAAPLK